MIGDAELLGESSGRLDEEKAEEIAKFQDAWHAMQMQVEEANARFKDTTEIDSFTAEEYAFSDPAQEIDLGSGEAREIIFLDKEIDCPVNRNEKSRFQQLKFSPVGGAAVSLLEYVLTNRCYRLCQELGRCTEEEITRTLDRDAALGSRDALAKTIHSWLFDCIEIRFACQADGLISEPKVYRNSRMKELRNGKIDNIEQPISRNSRMKRAKKMRNGKSVIIDQSVGDHAPIQNELEEKLSNVKLENQVLHQQALAMSPTGKSLSSRVKTIINQAPRTSQASLVKKGFSKLMLLLNKLVKSLNNNLKIMRANYVSFEANIILEETSITFKE
ncbi:myosin 2 [Actinidia rufa]|uniref:Myosin 2 n=1 Tax=Actinidia rufa TaxID=165716 RepID=A0A7J0F0W5_9ERIC|nr:myosin 2 [Actinidia rufa]